LPAFHARWFMNRLQAGYCEVVNPFNRGQRSRVDLRPEAVEVIVFWTRNAAPLIRHLSELDRRGFRYYFLHTLVDYPPLLEPHAPPLAKRIEGFRRLSRRLGRGRVVWRYDPIVLGNLTDERYHLERFRGLAAELSGYTRRVVVSLLDEYSKVRRRLQGLGPQGFRLLGRPEGDERLGELMGRLAETARARGMEIHSCAEKRELRPYGIEPGACIDPQLIQELFGISVSARKDPSQRPACRCAVSRDIGAYDTCGYGCVYCYACTSVTPEGSAPRRARGHPGAAALGEPVSGRETPACGEAAPGEKSAGPVL
jgi:DNA repair photolyase